MKEAVRQIVVTRERTPRGPRWAAAWRRVLLRYVGELERRKARPLDAVPPAQNHSERR
ncbi:MAG: hypothetical protein HPY83_11970 [Anaerolineae bacterium]|nr:hypothetical protein [Anaerolineae bacterium]